VLGLERSKELTLDRKSTGDSVKQVAQRIVWFYFYICDEQVWNVNNILTIRCGRTKYDGCKSHERLVGGITQEKSVPSGKEHVLFELSSSRRNNSL